MQSILKILLVLNVLLAGCRKEPYVQKDGYHVSCTIDGIRTTYVVSGAGHRTDPGNGIISFYAVLNPATPVDFIGVSVSSANLSKPVTAGNYTDTTKGFKAYGSFGNLTSRVSYGAGSTLVELAASAGINISNHLKVTVTKITKRTIRGTFSGDFYKQGDPGGPIKKVTDGSFYVRMS